MALLNLRTKINEDKSCRQVKKRKKTEFQFSVYGFMEKMDNTFQKAIFNEWLSNTNVFYVFCTNLTLISIGTASIVPIGD